MIKRNANAILQSIALAVLSWLCMQVVDLKVSVARIEAQLKTTAAQVVLR